MRLQGDLKTFNEAITLYDAAHPDQAAVARTYETVVEAEAFIAQSTDVHGVLKFLLLSWDKGATVGGVHGKVDELDAWKPLTLQKYFESI